MNSNQGGPLSLAKFPRYFFLIGPLRVKQISFRIFSIREELKGFFQIGKRIRINGHGSLRIRDCDEFSRGNYDGIYIKIINFERPKFILKHQTNVSNTFKRVSVTT